MPYCLDTNIVIAVLRNHDRVVARLRSCRVSDIRIPEIVRAELLFGCLKSVDPAAERSRVDHVLSPFCIVPFSGDAAEHYASIRLNLEHAGNLIGPTPASKAQAVPAAVEESAARSASVADSTVRIEVDVLDRLMNLVGELVLSRNQILQFAQTSDDPALRMLEEISQDTRNAASPRGNRHAVGGHLAGRRS